MLAQRYLEEKCHVGHQEVSRCQTRGESWKHVTCICFLKVTSPEVQNRGISDPTKMTYVLIKKFFKKSSKECFVAVVSGRL